MNVELAVPDCWTRVIDDNGDDCAAPQWVLPGEVITAYTTGVEVGRYFHDNLPELRALAMAAIEHAERQATGRVDRGDVTLT